MKYSSYRNLTRAKLSECFSPGMPSSFDSTESHSNPSPAVRRVPPNFGVKLARPGFGPAAELPTSAPA